MTNWVVSEYTDAFFNGFITGFLVGAMIFSLLGLIAVTMTQDRGRRR